MTLVERLQALATQLREGIDRWDSRYNGYVIRTDEIVAAWAVMKQTREAVDALSVAAHRIEELEARDYSFREAVADEADQLTHTMKTRIEELEKALRDLTSFEHAENIPVGVWLEAVATLGSDNTATGGVK